MNEMLPHPDLLQHLGLGYYLLGPDDEIIEVNSVSRDIFDLPPDEELTGWRLTDFYVNPDEARSFRLEVSQRNEVVSAISLMRRATGEWFYAEITARALFDRSGLYEGQNSIIRDVTKTEIQNRIVEWLPLGFYMVQVKDDRNAIAYCNTTFARMFGFKDRADAIGYDIAKLYQNRPDSEEFLDRIAESEEDNITRQVNVKSVDGKRFTVETTVKWTRDAEGNIVERYGLVRDLTHDLPLQHLRTNLANVLHTYTNNQIAVHVALRGAIDALGPSPFDPARRPDSDLIRAYLSEPTRDMIGALKTINDLLSGLGIVDEIIEGLFELEDALDQVNKIEIAYQLHAWLDIAKKVRARAEAVDAAFHLPEDALDSLLNNAAEIERLVLLVLLISRDADFVEIDNEVQSFYDYLNAGERTSRENQDEVVDLGTIVKQVCNDMGAFAISRGIVINGPKVSIEMGVSVNRRDLLRVVSNVIHNAVKYSWSPRGGESGEREVRVRLNEGKNEYILRVTNFGVPVPPDELQLVFESGYRGRLSHDRGRLGSGVGLSDAKSVIENFGGRIYLESKSIQGSGSGGRPDALRPNLTTVWIHLPKYEGNHDPTKPQENRRTLD